MNSERRDLLKHAESNFTDAVNIILQVLDYETTSLRSSEALNKSPLITKPLRSNIKKLQSVIHQLGEVEIEKLEDLK